MLIHVRTRGRPRAQDYQFLGGAPETFWWRDYRPVTDIERPTILVRSNGSSWQAYISGISSERADSTNVPIQFNLALAGDCGTGDDNALALSIIARSATSLAGQGGESVSGDLLDKELPADEIEQMLDTPGAETEAQAAAAVWAAYREPVAADADDAVRPDEEHDQPLATGPGETPFDGDWIGELADDTARDGFLALTARLLTDGQAGSALALNLVADSADLAELPHWTGILGVLSTRPGPQPGRAVQRLGKADPPPSLQERQRGRHRIRRPGPGRKTLIVTGATAAALALILVVCWLTILG